MHEPPSDSRHGPLVNQPTWRGVLAVYAAFALVPLGLFAVSNPLAGAVAVGALGLTAVAARRAAALVRCFRECQGFAFDLLGRVRITVSQPSADQCRAS